MRHYSRGAVAIGVAALVLASCNERPATDRSAEHTGKPALVKKASAAEPTGAQRTGTPGAPNATTTADPRQLPNLDPKFGGVIKQTTQGSQPWWPPRIVPPKGAPNVLLIMTDDAGYGVSSTFGGVIPTPTLDRLAKMGLRYTQFHSTALCSPTRAAIITGRNHHSVGFGVVAEQATGFPGYDSIIPLESVTVGRILKENGYATSWFGKNHNTPAFQYSAAGPFRQWPTGMGFDYFYGFMGGESDQWHPYLFRNTTPIEPWKEQPNYNLVTGMADDAIQHIKQLNAAAPDQPFFVYYVPGATHAPHQPTKEWIDKFKGKFDMGWNAMREQIFANQKRLGVIPKNTELTPWPEGQPEYGGAKLPTWDSLKPDEKKLFAHQAEVFAAYAAYTELQQAFVEAAAKYQVSPMDNSFLPRALAERPSNTAGRTEFVYLGPVVGTPMPDAPKTIGRSFSIQAQVDVPRQGTEGMLVTDVGQFGGYGLYLIKGKPVFTYNMLALELTRWEGAALAPGTHTIGFNFTYAGPGFGKGGTGVLTVDGKEVARKQLLHTAPFLMNLGETFDIGADTRTAVNPKDYKVPFTFTGAIKQIAVKLGPSQLKP